MDNIAENIVKILRLFILPFLLDYKGAKASFARLYTRDQILIWFFIIVSVIYLFAFF